MFCGGMDVSKLPRATSARDERFRNGFSNRMKPKRGAAFRGRSDTFGWIAGGTASLVTGERASCKSKIRQRVPLPAATEYRGIPLEPYSARSKTLYLISTTFVSIMPHVGHLNIRSSEFLSPGVARNNPMATPHTRQGGKATFRSISPMM
jgi:hypothetical protein